ATGVKAGPRHAALAEVLARRAARLDGTRRRDVVGRDGVSQHGQHARLTDVGHWRWLALHAVEVGRPLDVGGRRIPVVQLALRHDEVPPRLRNPLDVRVLFLEHLAADGLLDRGGYLPPDPPGVL